MDSLYLINIERALLSTILYDPEIIEDVLGVLKPKDFYLAAHQKIFAVMEELYRQDLPIDENFIKQKDVDEDVLIEIISSTAIANIDAYISEIKDESVKRELLSFSVNVQKKVEEDLPANEIIDSVQNELYQISTDSATKELKDISEITSNTLDYIIKIKERGANYLIGKPTGFVSLDKKTTGFNDGDLVIVAARPSMGKTAFVLNIALKNIQEGNGVIFFSLEMPAEQLMLRMLSSLVSIPLQDLRRGNLSDEQLSLLSKAISELNRKKFFVDDSGSVNINQLKARVRKLASNKENNISMVIIDYIGLMTPTGNRERHIEIQEISRGLKMLARELNIPVIALSQLNRSLESRPDKRPMLSDLRESGAIEQDADIIMFVYRDDVYKEREEARKEKEARDKGKEYKRTFFAKEEEEAEIIIGKQRNGPIGMVKLTFQKKYTRFVDRAFGNVEYENIETNKDTNVEISSFKAEDSYDNINELDDSIF